MTTDPFPTKEDIAKVLTETITFTGQIGILNIHHTINRLHDMFHKDRLDKSSKDPKQLSLL